MGTSVAQASEAPAEGAIPAGAHSPSMQAHSLHTPNPYSPSWLNRLSALVTALPGPNWAYYLGLGILLIAVESPLRWYEGTDPAGTINPSFVVNVLIIGGMLILLEHLDSVACSALERFRPALDMEGALALDTPGGSNTRSDSAAQASPGNHPPTLDSAQYESLCYQLATLPARPALVVSLAATLPVALQVITGSTSYMRSTRLYMAPLSGAVDLVMGLLITGVLGVFVYHTIWQLRLMRHIFCLHTRVHLFDTGPLYAFSRLTARTAIGLVLMAYAEMLVFPESWQTEPGFGGFAHYSLLLGLTAIAAVTFAWPLLGVHRLLAEEKEERLTALARRLEAAISELQGSTEADAKGPREKLDTLVLARNEVQRISTWPWRTGTVGGLVTTILLPLLLAIVTGLLNKIIQ